jgi:hypothetical protein
VDLGVFVALLLGPSIFRYACQIRGTGYLLKFGPKTLFHLFDGPIGWKYLGNVAGYVTQGLKLFALNGSFDHTD